MLLAIAQDPTITDDDKKAQLETDLTVMSPPFIRQLCRALKVDFKPLPRNKAYNITQILTAPLDAAIAAYVSLKLIVAHRKEVTMKILKGVFAWIKDNLASLVGIRTWQDGVNIILSEAGHLLG